ncbi:methyl-accepting chemotaxis protein [Neptuniibacter sp. QD34_54]|uniref:methyl-accepting chemotaxis protein n=1 Tax=Neptuniibacter sp. QD34_54 TaxID=3398208 RepID=UPI0039F5269B
MTLSRKLTIIFLAVGIVPMLILGAFLTYTSSNSLSDQALNKLQAVRSIKQNQIESYFAEREGDVMMLSEMINSMTSAGHTLNSVEQMLGVEGGDGSFFAKYINAYGYYDLFLINPAGTVFYTVTREADYGTNLLSGPYRDSGLANAFRNARDENKFVLEDFAPYAPSANAPASFIAYPIQQNGQFAGVIALQLSIEKIGSIMQERDGMGETGESYLVGSDKRMRSDSFLDPEGHSVIASFAGTVAKNGIDSVSVRQALNNNEGVTELIDYNGNPVLSAYTSVKVGGLTWALISEIDVAEALESVSGLKMTVLVTVLISMVIVIAVAYVFSRSITRPLGGEPHEMKQVADTIASGDLTLAIDANQQHGSAYSSMAVMADNLRKMVADMISISEQMARSSEETSVITTQTHTNTELQQNELTKISAAMVQMVATVQEVASNAQNVSDATSNASREVVAAQKGIEQTMQSVAELSYEVDQSNQAILNLEEYSAQIDSILAVIVSIAEQTNLLALNAAIEAARAGDHGRGFAVVADEVRSLAQRTQDSTRDIESIITQLKEGTRRASESMNVSIKKTQLSLQSTKEMNDVIISIGAGAERISEMMLQIASATEQQSCVADEIGENVNYIHQLAIENATGVGETAQATQHLSQSAGNLHQLIAQFKT